MGMELGYNTLFDDVFLQIFKFKDKEENTPADITLMRWLWLFGAFCKYKGIWTACRVVRWTVEEKPASVQLYANLGNTVQNMELFTQGEVFMEELDAFYSVFPLGLPIRSYIAKHMRREELTYQIMDGAIQRSLETAIVEAKPRFASKIKRALDDMRKGLWFVVERERALNEQPIASVLELPNTAKLLEPLQNSHDWSHQILLTKLGFSFNPEKRERLIVSELEVQTQEIKANRAMLTSLMSEYCVKYGNFTVQHMAEYYEQESLLAKKVISGRTEFTEDVKEEIFE